MFNPKGNDFAAQIRPLTNSLGFAAPLIAAGLGVALAFRAGLFNIGARGQMLIGAMFAGLFAFNLDLPMWIHLPLTLLAGIVGGAGLETPDEQWATTYAINVQAHVRAARLLMPAWVERGHGRFVVTASAAGLLSIGFVSTAAYNVLPRSVPAFRARRPGVRLALRETARRKVSPNGASTAPRSSAEIVRAIC